MKTETSSGRVWRWIAVAALSGCLLTAVLLARRTSQGQPAGNIEPRPAPLSAGAPRTQAHPDNARQVTAPTPVPAVTDDLCGVHGPDRMRVGNETLEQHVARLTQGAVRRWQGALAASEDARSQAISLALSNAQSAAQMLTREEFVPGNEPSKDTPTNNKLVLLATESRDPAIYSLAMGQCRNAASDMASGPCQGLSWQDWASIDPDNGMPWLWIATKAERAGDRQGVEEALDKASTASRIEAYGSALSALALGALPGGSSPLEKAVAWTDVVATLPGGPPMGILTLCSDAAIQQALRKQQCAAIATTLAKQASTVIGQALASSLADRLGFPDDMRAALKSEGKTMRAALSRSYPSDGGGASARFGCQNVLGLDDFVDALRGAGGNERAALLTVAAAGR